MHHPKQNAPMSHPNTIGTTAPDYQLTEPLDPDFPGVFRSIPAEDLAYRDRARRFVQDEVLPVIDDYWDRAAYPLQFVRRLGELDLLRDGIDIDRCTGSPRLLFCKPQAVKASRVRPSGEGVICLGSRSAASGGTV